MFLFWVEGLDLKPCWSQVYFHSQRRILIPLLWLEVLTEDAVFVERRGRGWSWAASAEGHVSGVGFSLFLVNQMLLWESLYQSFLCRTSCLGFNAGVKPDTSCSFSIFNSCHPKVQPSLCLCSASWSSPQSLRGSPWRAMWMQKQQDPDSPHRFEGTPLTTYSGNGRLVGICRLRL